MSTSDRPHIIGYTDRLSVAPGQTIRFMVSCSLPTYQADIVRLIHGDPRPIGPGFKEELMATDVSGEYSGHEQMIHAGSSVVVPDSPLLRSTHSLTLQAWFYPTTPGKGVQAIVTKWSDSDCAGYGLFLEAGGDVALRLGGEDGRVERFCSGVPLRASTWYFVAATFDADTHRVTLYQEPVRLWPLDKTSTVSEHSTSIEALGKTDVPLLIAASWGQSDGDGLKIGDHFNGKIDSPTIFDHALSSDEIGMLKKGTAPAELGRPLLAAWDFSVDVSSTKVTDTSGHEHHGQTINNPARAVTGRNWSGNQTNFNLLPAEYAAIHFHDDDIEDTGWDVGFEWVVPSNFRSGVYAARLRVGDMEDHVPFFVRPRKGTASARIAVLLPTLTYLAYADSAYQHPFYQHPPQEWRKHLNHQDHYTMEQGLICLYEYHSDGSDNYYASRLRPLSQFRPQSLFPLIGSPAHFCADLCLIDWLETKGYEYDVITDEDLHEEGLELLKSYPVVITGQHPEYSTCRMLEGIKTYLEQGGRLMYLGGNGFYFVTAIDPQRPHIMEIRRGEPGFPGPKWAVGEKHLSFTGEPGGLWQHRGRSAQSLVGLGTGGAYMGEGSPYCREAGSFDPRAAFIFEGIGSDEIIGDFGLIVGAAAGHEFDRIDYGDYALETPPPDLLLLASTARADAWASYIENGVPVLRSDITYLQYPDEGAVFSTGSMSWVGSLSHNQYENNVSRMTENVLRRFLEDQPLP